MITRSDVLTQGKQRLRDHSPSESPYLDALLLLSHTLKLSKEALLTSLEKPIWEVDALSFGKLLRLREKGLPIAYITRRKEFYGLEFFVDERVLIPRPDTEILVETALEIGRDLSPLAILDLCTGSGCIGISLKHSLPHADVSLADISDDALAVATLNARNILESELKVLKTDLFDSIDSTYDMIVTNPPYLTDSECDSKELKARSEPDIALRSGRDGFTHIRKIIGSAYKALNPGGHLLIEGGFDQAKKTRELMIGSGYADVAIIKDLGGNDRVVMGRRA